MKYLIATIALVMMYGCKQSTKSEISEAEKEAFKKKYVDSMSKELVKPKVSDREEPWVYQEIEDEMTEDKSYFASCQSTNVLYFTFPYDGGSLGQIIIRYDRRKTDVIIQVTKGQFSSSYSSETILVKFDNSAAEKWHFNEAASGHSNSIFIRNPQRFISKLKSSKQVKIEATFYNEGRQVLEFNISNLKWNH